jgi:signal transduction histidine kinase
MLRSFFLLFLFCLCWAIASPVGLHAQAKVNFDSLKTAIDRYPVEDTVKARMLVNFANDIRRTDQAKGIAAADQAIAIAERLHQPMLVADAYVAKGLNLFNQRRQIDGITVVKQGLERYVGQQNNYWAAQTSQTIGELYRLIGQYDNAKEFYHKAEAGLKKTGDKKGLAMAYNLLAVACINLSENGDALTYLNESLVLNKSLNNIQGIVGNYNNYGFLYTNLSNYNKALEYYQESLALNEKIGEYKDLASVYNNLSGVYYRLNDFSKSLEYDHKALDFYQKNNLQMQIGGAYVNMATKYKEMGDFDKALEYNLKGKSILEPLHAQQFIAICISNIGATYIDMKDFIKAYPYQIEALQMFEAMKNNAEIARIKYNLAAIINQISEVELPNLGIVPENRKVLSETYALDCIKIAKESGSLYYAQEGEMLLSHIYEKDGDYINALTAFRHFVAMRDSVSGEDIRQQITRKEIQYEFDKKESTLKFEQQLTLEQLEQQKLLSIQRQQALQINEQSLALSNKEKDLQRLAYLKEKAEKQEKEQALNLAEKDKQLQDIQLGTLLQEKSLQLKKMVEKNALIGFLLACLSAVLLAFAAFYWWIRQRQAKKEAAAQAQFTRQLLEQVEDDRGRIAIDLHDSVSHDLLLLKQSIQKEIAGPEVGDKIDNIINGIRHISRNLHPVMLDKIGLGLSLETLCEQFMQHETMYVSHEIEYKNTLSKSAELQLFRIVQEGLTNALKYSKAEAVKVQIKHSDNALRLDIQDNGKGFEVEKALEGGKAFGLLSIIQRAKAIKGNAEIRSGAGGTTISVVVG